MNGRCASSQGCFADGQWVFTPFGPQLIEKVRINDRVLTEDGFSRILWIMRHKLPKATISFRLRDRKGVFFSGFYMRYNAFFVSISTRELIVW